MQSDLSKRGLIKQVSGLDDETIDRLGGVTESGLTDEIPWIEEMLTDETVLSSSELTEKFRDLLVRARAEKVAESSVAQRVEAHRVEAHRGKRAERYGPDRNEDKPHLADSHPVRYETQQNDTDHPGSSRTGRDSEFRAYPYRLILGIKPCGECPDPDCGDGEVVDITNDVREMENRLARHEGQTNAIT